MLPEAKRKLILLYTKITGAILTIVVMMAFFVTLWMNKESSKELFLQYFNMALSKIRQEAVLDRGWIREIEGNQGILELWDNGQPFAILGEEKTEEEKEVLAACVEMGQKAKITPDQKPVVNEELVSEVLELSGSRGEKYFGKIGVVKVKGGFRSVVYLWRYSRLLEDVGKPFLWFLLFDLLGIGALYVFNRLFIGRILEPVERSRRQQNEFIAAASHELRSPLAVMKVNLAAAESMPEKQEDFIRLMKRECDRLSGLTEDLLLLASADAGRWRLERKVIDTEGLLIEIYESWQQVFKKQGMTLLLKFPEESLPEFSGDRKRTLQIFSILLSNALRFSEEGSQVVLRGQTGGEEKELWLLVEDYGVGVPEELREKIFERFYQADKARGEKEHFGLGLSIAREMAVLQGGRLFCEETKGGGATFVFCIPFLETI